LELTQISARFFLELALGLFAGLLLIRRRTIGAGFTRLTAAFTLASLLPGLLLVRNSGGQAPGALAAVAFGIGGLVVLAAAGRLPAAFESALIANTAMISATTLLIAIRTQTPQTTATTATLALASASTLASTLVLGLVTGAMLPATGTS